MHEQLKQTARQILPPQMYNRLLSARDAVRTLRASFGVVPRTCPVCSYQGRFAAFGFPVRIDCLCPSCGTVERHRFLRLWFDRNIDRLSGKRFLHFAPETATGAFIKPVVASYVTADLCPGRADLTLNIEALELPDRSFDVILCSHVLEHVDDKRALCELHRVLSDGGIVILAFPMIEGWARTYEDGAITSPRDRTIHFLQHDHVRLYGRDVRERITSAGFALEEFTAEEPMILKYGLLRGEKLFIGQKNAV